MLLRFFAELGPWNWMLLGTVLLALEIVVPGVYLLWIGIAAALTGALSLQMWSFDAWTWQIQVVVFLIRSLASAYLGSRLTDARRSRDTDEPLLNQRAEQLVGRTATLEEPIREGYGRVRLGDTIWRVKGPDLPAGSRVRVVSAKGGDLQVEQA